jgi:uncharacterized caspase-like protein
MADIFISYKREDLVLAKSLAMELTDLGWAVWWDHEIPAGRDYDEVIGEELDKSKCVIVLWSALSVKSRNVKDEANVGLRRNVLIPILIGNITPPFGFGMIQSIRWNDNNEVDADELNELLRQIKRLIGDPPKIKKKVEQKESTEFHRAKEDIEPKDSRQEQKTTTPEPQFKEEEKFSNYTQTKAPNRANERYLDSKFGKIKPDETYAVIVGIGTYKDGRIPKLNYTYADAKSMYELLLNPAHAGLKEENVKLLLNEDATLFNLKNTVSGWLFQNTKQNSTVFIYFAGHGGLESDRTGQENDGISKYLLPWDCNCDNLYASALSNTELRQLLSTVKAKEVIFFMDSCYAAGVTGKGARDIGVVDDFGKKIAEGEGRVVIASAKSNQRSWEDENIGHGIFTYHLLEALSGKADYDNDGYVSLWEVYKYLQDNVPDSVRKLSRSIQEPILAGDMSKDIFLTANANRLKEKLEEARLKRKKLADMYEADSITAPLYTQSIMLLEKSELELTDKERKLKRNLDAFLNGGLSKETFTDNWEIIMQVEDKPAQKMAPEVRSPSMPQKKFCTNCGNVISPTQVFCTRCGKRVK